MIETDSLTLKRMIDGQWKVPWKLIEKIKDIRHKIDAT